MTVYRGDWENPVLKEVIVHPSKYTTRIFKRGWARKPNSGETMGKNFIESFREAIETFVREGNEDKGKKLSAARIQEILILRHPMRYDIPSAHHIKSFMQSLLRKMKKNGETRTSTRQEPAQREPWAAQGTTYTLSTVTEMGVGDVCSVKADEEQAQDETTHERQNMEPVEYALGVGGRRGKAQKHADLIESLSSSGRIKGVLATEKAMLERLGVGSDRPSDSSCHLDKQ